MVGWLLLGDLLVHWLLFLGFVPNLGPLFLSFSLSCMFFSNISTDLSIFLCCVVFNVGVFLSWVSCSCAHALVWAAFCQTPLQLANPTQLQLVGEGVDFVFPWKKKKEGRNNPHLASSRRNDPICLKFGGCPVGV